jgi:hypothetical protein
MPNLGKNSFSIGRINFSKGAVLVGLFSFLLLEMGILVFLSRGNQRLPKQEELIAGKAILELRPKEGRFKVGEEFSIEVVLDTGNYETDATDFRLSFDPKILSVVRIAEGKIYDSYLAKRIDQVNGEVVINAIAPEAKTFQGRGIFATLFLKGLKPGGSNLNISFLPGSTTDSNVVAAKISKDVLAKVENADLVITRD